MGSLGRYMSSGQQQGVMKGLVVVEGDTSCWTCISRMVEGLTELHTGIGIVERIPGCRTIGRLIARRMRDVLTPTLHFGSLGVYGSWF